MHAFIFSPNIRYFIQYINHCDCKISLIRLPFKGLKIALCGQSAFEIEVDGEMQKLIKISPEILCFKCPK